MLTMEIDYANLKTEVDELNLDDSNIVVYNGRDYWIQPNSLSDVDIGLDAGKPAEWHKSSVHSGADVYIWSNVQPEFKKAMILHEIIEADLMKHQHVPIEESHRIAREHDELYASEIMNPLMLNLYKIMSAQMVIKHGILINDAA